QARARGSRGTRSPAICPPSRRSKWPCWSSHGRALPPLHPAAAVPGTAAAPRDRGGDGRPGVRPARRAMAGPPRPPLRARPRHPPAHQRLCRPRARRARQHARGALARRRDRRDLGRLEGTIALMRIERRSALAAERGALRLMNHASYREVVEKQFGSWDESEEDRLFDEMWANTSVEAIVCDGDLV